MSENTDYDKACREIARIAAALGIVDYSGDTSEIFDAIIIKDEKHQALAGENLALRSCATYFSYGTDAGYEEHPTAERARESAEADIDEYRGEACDGWSDEVDQVVWGVVIERSTQTGLRKRTDDDSCDSSIDEICDYVLLPEVETPATTQALNEIKAQGVDEFSSELGLLANCYRPDTPQYRTIKSTVFKAVKFASSLRCSHEIKS